LDFDDIRKLIEANSIRWTDHALKRIIQRSISRSDILHVLSNGEIIEEYPDDYPHPSCLVLGMKEDKSPLHIVCGIGDSELWVISVYYPDPEKWINNFKQRKEIKI